MISLTEMAVKGFKSLDDATLTFEPAGCTAIVGANNSGKSSILRAMQLFFEEDSKMNEDEKTKDYHAVPSIECTFELDQEVMFDVRTTQGLGTTVSSGAGQKIAINRDLGGNRVYTVGTGDGKPTFGQPKLNEKAAPAFLYITPELLPYQFNVGQQFQPPTMATLVRRFGLQSPSATVARRQQEEQTKRAINTLLQAMWKATKSGSFDYILANQVASLTIEDEKDRYALADVGSGLQRSLAMAVQMEDAQKSAGARSILVVVDEPENSLHPAAQRDLLRFFKSLKNTQVIYATHSPSMIDTASPETIRTMIYDIETGRSRMLKRKHLHDNYETIRLALGILPTDSLSTGFVNVVVEGAIELLVLPIWARKLSDAGHVELDLNLVRFLNGGGSSVPVYFDVAISSGMPTIAVVDNDPAGRGYARKIEDRVRQKYELCYKPVHYIARGDADADLESLMSSARLIAAINEVCQPRTPIGEDDLAANPVVRRSKNIEDFLMRQNIELDEFKTDVAIAVARSMEPDEIPPAIADIFQAISRLLEQKQHVKARP